MHRALEGDIGLHLVPAIFRIMVYLGTDIAWVWGQEEVRLKHGSRLSMCKGIEASRGSRHVPGHRGRSWIVACVGHVPGHRGQSGFEACAGA